MPLILDTNCFANVFNKSSEKHHEFEPILKWITKGKGKLVYGGTTYKLELKKARKFIPIFNLLKQIGKAIEVDNNTVDQIESEIKTLIDDSDFDDQHLPAIVRASRCRVICSEDKRSIKFVQNRTLYPKGIDIPKYYCGKRNKRLLSDEYIDSSLKPLAKTKAEDSNRLEKLI